MIHSYSLSNNYYIFYDNNSNEVTRFNLLDSRYKDPAMGASDGGVTLIEDSIPTGVLARRQYLSPVELSNCGFASAALFKTQFDTDKTTLIGGGGGVSTEVINVLDDASVAGDGATDDTAAINAIIAANEGKILYFAPATYLCHITVGVDCILLGSQGAILTWASTTDPVITISNSADVRMSDFYCNSTNAAGKGIDNDAQNSKISNCYFRGFQNDATGDLNTEVNIYDNCTFEIHTAISSDLGTLCWSAAAEFNHCSFIGTLGADVQDSTFNSCIFGENEGATEWGVHMPLGTVDNAGSATTFGGDAKFYNCTFYAGDNALTDTYACGLGNAAHPEFYDCAFIGNLYGLYCRSESTILCENCYFRAKMTSAGASSLAFLKFNPGGWPPGVDGEGDSIVRGGTIVTGEYSLLVPASAALGSVSLDGVSLEWDKLIAIDSGGSPQANNDAFLYITSVTAFPDSLFESIAVTAGDQVIDPPYTPSGVMFVELANDAAGTRNVRLTRFYRNPDGFYRNGTVLILRGTSDTNTCTVKNGYWAAEGTLTVCASNNDIVLANGDVAVFIYYTNTWHELTNFNMSENLSANSSGQLLLGANSKFQFTATSTIPSPATNVLYLDDGTNHGLGGVATLMFHNGVGWNALF